MRVVAGLFRGRRLSAPRGLDVRPTPDRVREALFDILGERVRGCAFLDLFAGSGANGIEALSRGADRVVFIENARAALENLETNLATLGIAERVQVCRSQWPAALDEAARQGSFSIVFADPPYARADYPGILQSLCRPEIVLPEGLVVLEHESRTRPPAEASTFHRTRTARYGNVSLAFYSRP